jgi:KUP system potassium uptake protein
MSDSAHSHNRLSSAGVLISLGIIFGDIGTSPLYVIKAIIGEKPISYDLVYGGVSCVFWTLLIITTFKYVYLALNADNKGEGGIFALYALVRRYNAKWVIYPAIIGCASLIADGFITPPISISSAIEGMTILYPSLPTVPIVLAILVVLFLFQQVGTNVVGKAFGPIMMIWFLMIGALGINQIVQHPEIFKALNPYYAFNLLANYPSGFWLLGAVFLCTTGGEALYSDLGHCGKENIRISWFLVIICLLLNYLGQSAFLISNYLNQPFTEKSTFFALMPASFLPYGIVIASVATIIASQALISGCFSLVNEAIKLKLWINMKVNYPSQLKGQIYIPSINWFLLAGCIAVVLIFRESTKMEAAYGLAITMNMLMTSSLLLYYFYTKKIAMYRIVMLGFILVPLEIIFFMSNMDKFFHGGWFSIMLALVLFFFIFMFYEAKKIREKHTNFVPLQDYIPMIEDLMADNTIPKDATNLVYLSMADNKRQIDSNIIYSIFRKKPRRADIYWFVHVDILDEPFEKKYSVDTIVPEKVFFVKLAFGFKVEHKVNRMFFQIVEELVKNGEVDELSHYPSLRGHNLPADFKFILLNSRLSVDSDISPYRQFVVRAYRILKRMSLSTSEDFGLELSNVEVETVPINVAPAVNIKLKREFS